MDSFLDLPRKRDLKAVFEGPQYTKWQAFRESEDSRYVGLTMPRFLLRLPYGQNTVPCKAFNYEEDVVGEHGRYLWGATSYAFATSRLEHGAQYNVQLAWSHHLELARAPTHPHFLLLKL